MRGLALALMLTTACARAAGAAETIAWDAAEQHVGEDVVVEGRVLGAHCSPTSCLLAFDPTFNRFTAVVQASGFKTLPPETLKSTFVGRKVRVHGKIQLLERKPEIIISGPDDLQLVVTEQERREEKSAASADVLDRIDGMLDRIDELSDRLEATQARLDQLAAALDERTQQLAAIAAQLSAPPPSEPEPTYGEPQPRPRYEALRTIKRGMTSDEVARLVGAPITAQSGPNGIFVWDYGYGRSIAFDRRGRATSLVGFPNP